MKKVIKGILILIVFALYVTTTKAECDAMITIDNSNNFLNFSVPTNYHMQFTDDNNPHNKYFRYDFKDKYKRTFTIPGFCQNPGLSTGGSVSTNFCRESIITDTSSENLQKIEYGIVWILREYNSSDFFSKDYGKVCNNYGDKNDCKNTIVAATLRMYDLLFKELNNNQDLEPKTLAHESLYNEIISGTDNLSVEINSIYKDITGSYPKSISGIKDYNVIFSYGTDAITRATESILKNEIKTLLKEALNAVSKYKPIKRPEVVVINTEESPVVTNNSITNIDSNVIQNMLEAGVNIPDMSQFITTSKTIEYTLSVKNLSNDNKNHYFRLYFTCDECDKNKNLFHQFSIFDYDKNAYVKAPDYLADYNLKQYIENEQLKFMITITNTENNCKDIPFKIKIAYSDFRGEGYVYYNEKRTVSNEFQKFYVFVNHDIIASSDTVYGETIIDLDGKINLCYTCDDLKKECNEGNINSCIKAIELGCYTNCSDLKKLCDKKISSACEMYNQKCKDGESCSTHIENISCRVNNTLLVADGYDFDESTCSNNSNLDILKCVIEKKDLAGNDYKSEIIENNYELIKDNDYCTVSCREEYRINMPGNINVNSGRYFTLQVQNKGLKACYTSKIDTDLFKQDLLDAENNLLDAWNEWNKWYSGLIYSRLKVAEDGPKNIPDNYFDSFNMTVITARKYWREWKYDYYEKDRYGNWKQLRTAANTDDEIYKENEFGQQDSSTTHYDGGYAWINEGNAEKKDGEIEILNARMLETYSNAEVNLKNAITTYKSILSHYNACNGEKTIVYNTNDYKVTPQEIVGWKMTYEYNPTITFDYSEKYMSIATSSELVTTGTSNISESPKQTTCKGNVSNDYVCNSSDIISANDLLKQTLIACQDSGETKNIKLKLKNDFGSSSDQMVSLNIYSCGAMDIKLSNAKYVKQEMNVDANYITPTQFYQIYPLGSIITLKNNNADIINSSVIENGLPVSLGTKKGEYNYLLKISDLGEYYNNNKLGRLIGTSNSVLEASLKDTKCESNGAIKLTEKIHATYEKGVYVCKYLVNYEDEYKCQIIDGNYYGKNGTIVSKTQYESECGNDEYKCQIINGQYYGKNGTIVSQPQYDAECGKDAYKCQIINGQYYGKNGTIVSPAQYDIECGDNNSYKCQIINGRYYDNDGKLITNASPYATIEKKYKAICCAEGDCPPEIKYECRLVNGIFYGKSGNEVNETQYKSECCPDGECPVECESCIRNNIVYRSITPEDLNPNNRKLGKNWRFDENNISTAMELKAYATTTEIVSDGEKIYDIDFDNKNNEDFAIEITMDARIISMIRTHNQEIERQKVGGFVNNSLKCYDYTNTDGTVYKNIFCYSTFIDKLLIDSHAKNNIKISVDRPLTEAQRINYKPSNKYWTVWTDAVENNSWTIKTVRGIAYYKTNYGTNINIGPSWK